MKLFKALLPLKNHLDKQNLNSLGLVPTMGALHDGHLALVKGPQENAYVVVSIFVNPTQFDDVKDLNAYPQTLKDDIEKLGLFGDKLLSMPLKSPIFIPIKPKVSPMNSVRLIKRWKGSKRGISRGRHNSSEATRGLYAYTCLLWGKDFQQLTIIQALVEQKQLPIEIVNCPIVREKDGLAMSSRNRRLSPQHRKLAPKIYTALLEAKAQKESFAVEKLIGGLKTISISNQI